MISAKPLIPLLEQKIQPIISGRLYIYNGEQYVCIRLLSDIFLMSIKVIYIYNYN